MSDAARQRGFRLDTDLCTGCGACAVACAIENELPWGTSWRWIETFNPRHVPGLPSYHLSLACNHCAAAPCMEHCPALAYGKDPITGAVLLDPDRCIGCKYCTWACPYDAPRFDPDAGVVSKCTFCHDRQLQGLAPACVQQCPTGALSWGEMKELAGSPLVPGFPETAARPSVRFARRVSTPPTAGGAAATPFVPAVDLGSLPADDGPGTPRTSLASEGPLVVFTLLVAVMAGCMATTPGRDVLGLVPFLLLSATAAAASALHLGRKARAWRALLNLRRSWLSREVALFSSFVPVAALSLAPVGAPSGVSWAAAGLGMALLVAVDRVYAVTRTRGLVLHSAGAVSTGLLVAGLAAGVPVLWGGVLLAKGASYLARKLGGWDRTAPVRPGWSVLRLGAATAGAGLLLVSATPGASDPALVAGALALLATGEIVDRCEFYLDLDVSTPHREMSRSLLRAAARAA